jgi:hypothetical protein
MRFLGLGLCDTVPDEKMIWEYREHLVQANVIEMVEIYFKNIVSRGAHYTIIILFRSPPNCQNIYNGP